MTPFKPLIILAAAASALDLTACEREPAVGSNDAMLNQAIAEAKAPTRIPGAGDTATTVQTGSTTRGTANSDVSIGAPKRGTTGTNAH